LDAAAVIDHSLDISCLKLGIVCPMANEEETAVGFVNEVLDQCARRAFKTVTFFAVLDNVSKDNTLELLRQLAKEQPTLRVVWAPENSSVVDAYVRGYQEALAAGCDWILEIDAGYSHQPSDIPQFFERMLEGYACVFGSRFCEGGRMLRVLSNDILSAVPEPCCLISFWEQSSRT